MAYCGNCGGKIAANDRFCETCGINLTPKMRLEKPKTVNSNSSNEDEDTSFSNTYFESTAAKTSIVQPKKEQSSVSVGYTNSRQLFVSGIIVLLMMFMSFGEWYRSGGTQNVYSILSEVIYNYNEYFQYGDAVATVILIILAVVASIFLIIGAIYLLLVILELCNIKNSFSEKYDMRGVADVYVIGMQIIAMLLIILFIVNSISVIGRIATPFGLLSSGPFVVITLGFFELILCNRLYKL